MTTILEGPLTPTHMGGLKINKVNELPFTFNMMIYGDWGVGKTLLAGQADDVPEMRKVLFIDCEAGTQSLRDFPNIDVVRVTTWDEMQMLYDELRRMHHSYQTIVVDSLTELQQFNMDQVMAMMLAKDNHEHRDEDVPGLHEWNVSSKQIRKFVRAFRDLPMSTIFTALAKQDLDRMKVPTTVPSLPGKLAREIPAFLDYVFYYYTDTIDGEDLRLLRTTRGEKIAAKQRTGLKNPLPDVIGKPSMKQLFNLIKHETPKETINV